MVEATGRTREAAVAAALAKLGVKHGDAEVTLVEERRHRFLGLFGGPEVRVRVRRRAGIVAGDSGSDAERTGDLPSLQRAGFAFI